MVVDDDGSKWLRPLKLREYFVDHSVDDAMHAEKKLYLAVVCGEVRARRNGRLLGPEWLRQFRNMKPDPNEPFSLPRDLELSTEDAERIWPPGQRYEKF
jgi:hypothetical protein